MSYRRDDQLTEPCASGPSCNADGVPEFLVAAAAELHLRRIDQAAELLNDRAIETVWQMFEKDPSRTDLVFKLAEVLVKAGREKQAEHCYKKLLDLSPSPAVYNKLGWLCQCTGRMSQALEYQRQAVQVEPDSPELWANLARILMETGDMQQGIELLEKAVDKVEAAGGKVEVEASEEELEEVTENEE